MDVRVRVFSVERAKAWMIAAILLSSLGAIVGGLFFLEEIPKSYGWYEIASNILNGHGPRLEYTFPTQDGPLTLVYHAVRPPLYLGMYLLYVGVLGESLIGFLLIQSLLLICISLTSWMLFSFLYGKRIGYILAGLMALYPLFLTRTWNAAEDVLYIPLIIIALYFTSKAIRNDRIWDYAIAGALFGLTFITRGTVMVFIILLGLYFLARLKRERLVGYALFGIGFVIAIMPLLVINYQHYERVILSDHGGSRFWVANNHMIASKYGTTSIDQIEKDLLAELSVDEVRKLRSMSHLEQEDRFREVAVDFILHNPGEFVSGIARKVLISLNPIYNPHTEDIGRTAQVKSGIYGTARVILILLGVCGYIVAWRQEPQMRNIMLLLYASMLVLAAMMWVQSRHTIAYDIVHFNGIALLIRKYAK